MGSTIHLVTGQFAQDRTAELLAQYRARRSDVGSVLWLAPSQIAADEVLSRLATTAKPLLMPNVFSVDQFARIITGQSTSDFDRLRRTQALDAAIRVSGQHKARTYFARVAESRGFVAGAMGLMDELQQCGITSEQFASACNRRGAKLKACTSLYAAFAQEPGQEESIVVKAARVIDKGLAPPFDSVRAVFIDGFTSFTPAVWQLIAALSSHVDLWLTLPDDDGDRPEAFASAKRTREQLESRGPVEVHTCPMRTDRAAGLEFLGRRLFGGGHETTNEAPGLRILEAPGTLGEARLVARRIRTLLGTGARPEDVVVTARDVDHVRDLLDEVFAEYGLPIAQDGDEPIIRNPAVSTLLRALRLPEDDWPFAGVTALLRSTYFRPEWPEADGDVARHAETLLRLLDEPRGRDAYLKAAQVWSESPPPALEDEQAEESRRQRQSRLATRCRPFLERFFSAWEKLQAAKTFAAYAAAVREFAQSIGLESVSNEVEPDRRALEALRAGIESDSATRLSRSAFQRRLTATASAITLPRSPRTAGRVRVVPAEEARHLDCEYLFILGLGEGSFPRLSQPVSLLNDVDRQQLREAGLPFADPQSRLGDEQRLFLELVGRPRRELVFSYSAVDERGQAMLTGSFFSAVRACFAPGAIAVESQRMLIEGYFTRDPLSIAEARSRVAQAFRNGGAEVQHPDLPSEICIHLTWAREVAAARFAADDYNGYDGLLSHPTALAAVRDRFGTQKVFSPSALEAYVACPFRYFIDQVLRLEELGEPGEEVEHTRRGAAIHRALSRLHQRLRQDHRDIVATTLPEHVNEDLRLQVDAAIQEYARRTPSLAARKLWELEGRRLARSVAKYRGHWDGFLDPWRKLGANLGPTHMEAGFGLPPSGTSVDEEYGPLVLDVGGVEVRIGGRIDRVDVAELEDGLGFWVIDYKSGRATNYTASELARFEKLQLPLYALAVERVLYPGQPVRTLGLAYWLVTDSGPKTVSPGTRQALGWFSDPKKWATFRTQLEAWVAGLVGHIRAGRFPLAPRSEHCTDTCSFGTVCRIAQSRNSAKAWELALPTADEEPV
ncbi:MAG TPA: PD-(D/E)XK nuclease family protein [Gemmataceae bacterium]|nr:PD-(D/E)XK nuclease family protein [Gemmataceae bacterium]